MLEQHYDSVHRHRLEGWLLQHDIFLLNLLATQYSVIASSLSVHAGTNDAMDHAKANFGKWHSDSRKKCTIICTSYTLKLQMLLFSGLWQTSNLPTSIQTLEQGALPFVHYLSINHAGIMLCQHIGPRSNQNWYTLFPYRNQWC